MALSLSFRLRLPLHSPRRGHPPHHPLPPTLIPDNMHHLLQHTHDTTSQHYLNNLLQKHNVQGLSIARLDGGRRRTTICAGHSHRDDNIKITPSTWLQQASLSKTIAASFAVSYYKKRGIPMTTKVSSVLHRLKSPFHLNVAPGIPQGWLDELQLQH